MFSALLLFCFISSYVHSLDLHSFPTRRSSDLGRAEVSPGPFLFTHRSVPVGHGHESFEPCMPRPGRIRTEFPDRIGPCSHVPLTKQSSKTCELALLLVFFLAGPLVPGLTFFPLPLFLLGGLFGGMPLLGPSLVLGGFPGECPSQSSDRDGDPEQSRGHEANTRHECGPRLGHQHHGQAEPGRDTEDHSFGEPVHPSQPTVHRGTPSPRSHPVSRTPSTTPDRYNFRYSVGNYLL